jgi:hypothetical protein
VGESSFAGFAHLGRGRERLVGIGRFGDWRSRPGEDVLIPSQVSQKVDFCS